MLHYFGHVYPCPLGGPCFLRVPALPPLDIIEETARVADELYKIFQDPAAGVGSYHIPAVTDFTARTRSTTPASAPASDSPFVELEYHYDYWTGL